MSALLPVTYTQPRARQKLALLLLAVATVAGCAAPGGKKDAPSQMLHRVSEIEELGEAVAKAQPGTTIVVTAGTYVLDGVTTLSAVGTASRPIIIRAAQGGVTLDGPGGLEIESSDWLVLHGFTLAWQARTMNVRTSSNVRLTNTYWRYEARSDETRRSTVSVPWLRFHDGYGHRVDHNEFGPHPGGLGVTLLVENAVTNIRIDRNYFHDRPRDGRNGAETIRIGSGGGSRIDAIIESNLFERNDGESELISIKSDGASIVGNTFRDNRGQVVIRNGMDILIARNLFFSGIRGFGGGIRVHGSRICIAQNQFHEVPNHAVQTLPGQFDRRTASALTKGYPSSNDVVLAGNMFVQPGSTAEGRWNPIDAGVAREEELPASNWLIVNNYFITDNDLLAGDVHHDFHWQGNVQITPKTAAAIEPSDAMPGAVLDQGRWQVGYERLPVGEQLSLPDCDAPTDIVPVRLR